MVCFSIIIITHLLLASKLLRFSLSSGLSSARSSGSAEGSDTLAQDTLYITQNSDHANSSATTHLLGRGPLLPSAAILAARRLASSASWSSASDSYA